MTAVFTDFFRGLLYDSLDKTAPIDPSVNLMNGKSVYWVLWRSYGAMTDEYDPRYTAIETVDDLVEVLGWGAAIDPPTSQYPVGTTTAGTTTYCLANNAFTMGSGWEPSTVSAGALVMVGTHGGVVDPIIYITDTPFEARPAMDADDSLIARPSAVVGGNRPIFSWPIFVVGSTTVIPNEGSVAVLEAPPTYETAYTKHAWVYPQRVNFIANPSFELGTNHWRAGVTRTQGTEEVPAAPGGGAWYGVATDVAESNTFPLLTEVTVGANWTIQAMVRGTGRLKVALLAWGESVTETSSDWGPDTDVWDLTPDGWTQIYALRTTGDNITGLVRFEVEDGGTFHLDNVLCEPDWLKGWQYFDGDSTYGARADFAWYGGDNRKGQTYSTWYNHKRAVTGRLFAWDIGADDFVITDEEVESQGFVYKWVPAGVRVTPHLDVLFEGDIQESVTDNAGTDVLPYKVDEDDLLGVLNPWA